MSVLQERWFVGLFYMDPEMLGFLPDQGYNASFSRRFLKRYLIVNIFDDKEKRLNGGQFENLTDEVKTPLMVAFP